MTPIVMVRDGTLYWTLAAMVYAHCVSPESERFHWIPPFSVFAAWVAWCRACPVDRVAEEAA